MFWLWVKARVKALVKAVLKCLLNCTPALPLVQRGNLSAHLRHFSAPTHLPPRCYHYLRSQSINRHSTKRHQPPKFGSSMIMEESLRWDEIEWTKLNSKAKADQRSNCLITLTLTTVSRLNPTLSMQGLSVSVTGSRLREFLEQLPQTNFRKKFQSRWPIYGPVNIKNAQYFKKVKLEPHGWLTPKTSTLY